MATTTLRRDYLMRRIVNPGTDARDHLNRATTATVDSTGRALVARDYPGAVAVTLGEFLDVTGTRIVYQVTVAGTAAAGAPSPPGVGNTVVSGTATLRQITTG
jgi:uncharacterized membrane protein